MWIVRSHQTYLDNPTIIVELSKFETEEEAQNECAELVEMNP